MGVVDSSCNSHAHIYIILLIGLILLFNVRAACAAAKPLVRAQQRI